ncbi:alpha/beta hydrolase [Chitinophaga rhizophila]|uniref:Esterase family protein n=1 Tax=Chitinophaga rhizophila TaxID=2866212 RepID=A0ABS7GB67_9BACT|nr:alpha/beta hydrolase family protein [Chitinophaga rhizophila]MBW8684059.1 esterase family protein [Chitinophaga rhizophila]
MKYMLGSVLLLLGFFSANAAKVDTVAIYSKAMHKSLKCVVITPDSYQDKQQRYPVVYILHGHSGNYSNYITKIPAIAAVADAYQMILVCPDGGYNSWYLDSPVDSAIRFETYVGKEIPSFIDANYRTKASRESRAITGLSMGGHGALYLAIRHQETFGAAGSMSGGVDVRPFPNNWELSQKLGSYKAHAANWDQHVVVNQLSRLKSDSLSIIIDCGVKDFFIDVNRQLHQRMLEQGIAHDYIERAGAHTWEYWSNSIMYQLFYFHRFFK